MLGKAREDVTRWDSTVLVPRQGVEVHWREGSCCLLQPKVNARNGKGRGTKPLN